MDWECGSSDGDWDGCQHGDGDGDWNCEFRYGEVLDFEEPLEPAEPLLFLRRASLDDEEPFLRRAKRDAGDLDDDDDDEEPAEPFRFRRRAKRDDCLC